LFQKILKFNKIETHNNWIESQDAPLKKISREETSLYLSNLPATTEEDIRASNNILLSFIIEMI